LEGTAVLVGRVVGIGGALVAVAVGGTRVAEGGTGVDVFVGRTVAVGVDVGGTGVAVGGTGVAVAVGVAVGSSVGVGGTGVAVGGGAAEQPANRRQATARVSRVRTSRRGTMTSFGLPVPQKT
jgi:hypothetical protein